ncbi:MAG: hypothetical protein GKR91_06570 [Pseudomonadales bacterium]|nr:hypothetical protein [Pseudomonadales bacterium]
MLLLSLIVACSSGGGFPQIANPPPFDYADGEELRSRMHQLAFELQELDLLMYAEDNRDARFQQQVVSSLEDIERLGGLLRQTDLSTRHRFMLDDMTRFLSTISRARQSAERNPPGYYQAGRVSGACVNCHRTAIN